MITSNGILQGAAQADEPKFTGEVASGFIRSCLPFTTGAAITFVILSLDIISDWAMYRNLDQLQIPDQVEEYTALLRHNNRDDDIVWKLKGLYLRIPDVILGFCILGSIIYLLFFTWLGHMFIQQRKKFKNRRDGVPHKKHFPELYGGELFILLHMLCEDLPIAALFFMAQTSVNCKFLLDFDDVIFYLCIVTTGLSLSWKLIQVAWNAGCFSYRENPLCSTGLNIIRLISLIFVVSGWVLTAMNLVLLGGAHGNFFTQRTFGNEVFDKVGIDRYIRDQYIVFSQRSDKCIMVNTHQGHDRKLRMTIEGTHYLDIIAMKDILYSEKNEAKLIRVPCNSQTANVTFVPYFNLEHQSMPVSECSVIFKFHHQKFKSKIQYDTTYAFTTVDSSGKERCISGRLRISPNDFCDLPHSALPDDKTPLNNRPHHFTPTIANVNADSNPQTSSRGMSKQEASQPPSIIQNEGPTQDYQEWSSSQNDRNLPNSLPNQGQKPQQNSLNYLSYKLSRDPDDYKNCKLTLELTNAMLSHKEFCPQES